MNGPYIYMLMRSFHLEISSFFFCKSFIFLLFKMVKAFTTSIVTVKKNRGLFTMVEPVCRRSFGGLCVVSSRTLYAEIPVLLTGSLPLKMLHSITSLEPGSQLNCNREGCHISSLSWMYLITPD